MSSAGVSGANVGFGRQAPPGIARFASAAAMGIKQLGGTYKPAGIFITEAPPRCLRAGGSPTAARHGRTFSPPASAGDRDTGARDGRDPQAASP